MIRWVSNKDGSRVSVPEEILDSPVGSIFGGASNRLGPRKLVEEVS
jgi:Ino eighty subunit 2